MSKALLLEGRLTIHTAAEQHARLLSALELGTQGLDLSRIEEFDTAGVQLLLACRQQLADQGLRLQISAASPAVQEVLGRYALDELLA